MVDPHNHPLTLTTTITDLNLDVNRLKERGEWAIEKALAVNTTLTQLNLGLTLSRRWEGGR